MAKIVGQGPAGGQFPHGFSQQNTQKPVGSEVDQVSDLAHVNKQRKLAEQSRTVQGIDLEQNQQF